MDKLIPFLTKHWLLVALFIICLIALFIEEARSKGLGKTSISPAQATQMINREHAVVLDIRDPNAFKNGMITGSINIPLATLSSEKGLDKIKDKKQEPIILVCAMGQSVTKAFPILQKAGFENVYILKGGLNAWKNDSLPLVKK